MAEKTQLARTEAKINGFVNHCNIQEDSYYDGERYLFTIEETNPEKLAQALQILYSLEGAEVESHSTKDCERTETIYHQIWISN